MKLWAVVENGKPLEAIEQPDPEPTGTEVVVAVSHCGICHSDLHFWKGEYDLGNGTILRIADRGVTLPRAPGHEVLGRVVAVGPDAEGVSVGDSRIVYPWIGCGTCAACAAGTENLCNRQTSIGVVRHGGFGSHVVVPHPRYLFDHAGIDAAVAATLPCSGITVYSAIHKLGTLDPDTAVVLVGAGGGLGLAAIAMLRALGHRAIVGMDLGEAKCAAARAAGATAVVDAAAPDAAAQVAAAAGGPPMAAIDFVNSPKTAAAALDMLGKDGKLVLVGVGGGTIPLSLAGMIFRPRSIIGSATGSFADLRAVIGLAQSGRLQPVPVTRMPKDEANAALARLKSGTVAGRIVLVS